MNIAKGRKNMNITEDLAAFCERTAKEREKSINSYCSAVEDRSQKAVDRAAKKALLYLEQRN